jgi:hypothetical protein
MSPQLTISVFWVCSKLRMDYSLLKNSKKFLDGALYRAKIQIFESVDFNFKAQPSISLSR